MKDVKNSFEKKARGRGEKFEEWGISYSSSSKRQSSLPVLVKKKERKKEKKKNCRKELDPGGNCALSWNSFLVGYQTG